MGMGTGVVATVCQHALQAFEKQLLGNVPSMGSAMEARVIACEPSTCSQEILHGGAITDRGSCWHFEGSRGSLTITLQDPSTPPPSSLTLLFDFGALTFPELSQEAPKDLAIYVIGRERIEHEVGRFECAQPKTIQDYVQTFPLNIDESEPVTEIQIRIESNHGSAHTTLCGVRLSGKN